MQQVITAIYEHGVLQPVKPLHLQEHQRVTVQIVPDSPQETVEHIVEWLVSVGRLTPPRKQPLDAPLAEAERLQLAHLLGNATEKPLSEVILDERGER